MKVNRPLSLLLLSLLVCSLFVASLPIFVKQVEAKPDHALEVRVDEDYYYVKGDVIQIRAFSNESVFATLRVYWNWKTFTDNELIYQNTQQCNATWNLPTANQKPGFYKIIVSTSEHTVTMWRTLIHYTDYSPSSLPFNHTWRGVSYTLKGRSLRATNGEEWFNITYPKIPFEHTTNFYRNNMTFLIRLSGATWDVDLLYSTIHSGLKWAINGTLDNPQTFEFKLANVGKWKKRLNRLRSGKHLVFDWGDLKKAGKAFSWNSSSKTLSVNIPSSFDIDPEIFKDGFESGYTPWDGTSTSGSGTLGIATDRVHCGVNSSKSTHGGSAAAGYCHYNFGDYGLVYARCYLQANKTVNTSWDRTGIFYIRDENNAQMILGLECAKGVTDQYWRVTYRDAGSYTVIADYDSGLTADRWFTIEVKVNCSSADGNLDGDYALYINGSEIWSVSGIDTDSTTTDYIRVGIYQNNDITANEFWHDCVIISDEYIGLEAEAPTEHNLSGNVTRNSTVTRGSTWEFVLEHLVNQVTTIVGESVISVLQLFGGVVNLVVNVLSEKTISFTVEKTVTRVSSLSSGRGWTSTILASIPHVLTVNGAYSSAVVTSISGVVNHVVTLTHTRGVTFLWESLLNPVATIEGSSTFVSASTLFISGVVNQVYTIARESGWVFLREAMLNPVWTINSFVEAAAILNLEGVVNLVSSLASERVWSFTILPVVGQLFTISGVADIFVPGTYSLSGVIGLLTQVAGSAIHIFPSVDTNDQEIMLVAVAVLLPAVLAVGILVKRSIDKKGVEERGILDYI